MQQNEENIIDENKPPDGLLNTLENFTQLNSTNFNFGIDKFWQIQDQNISVKIETDLDACKELFNKFSPKKTLFELWDFRFAFYLGYGHKPVFFLFEKDGKEIGLLPLWFENDKKELRWFGSWWQEANVFWIKEKKIIPSILSFLPENVYLNALKIAPRLAKKLGMTEDGPKFLLSLKQYPTIDKFLERFSCKKRYNFKRDQKIINSLNPKTVINRFSDIEILFDLSVKRFARFNDESMSSVFIYENRKQTFREIMNLAKEYKIRVVSTEINNEVVGVDLVAIYKGVYYALNGAYDIEKYPGLGNYTNLLLIQDAMNLKLKAVDFLEESYGWKENWFDPIRLFQYRKNNLS